MLVNDIKAHYLDTNSLIGISRQPFPPRLAAPSNPNLLLLLLPTTQILLHIIHHIPIRPSPCPRPNLHRQIMMRITLTCMQRRHIIMRIILFLTGLLFGRSRLLRHRWSKLALRSQLLAEEIEADRDWDAKERETTQECGSPFDAEVVEHLASEERKAGGCDGSKEGVACDCRGSADSVSESQRKGRFVLTT